MQAIASLNDSGVAAARLVRLMPKKILVVEDDALNQRLFRDVLTDEGYVVVAVGEGVAALRAAKADKPDLVLMDVQLPAVSGLEVTRWFKDDPGLAAMAAGCAAFLPKPVAVSELLDVISQHLA
jgi:two-component system, cell cycle response regulator DivK